MALYKQHDRGRKFEMQERKKTFVASEATQEKETFFFCVFSSPFGKKNENTKRRNVKILHLEMFRVVEKF